MTVKHAQMVRVEVDQFGPHVFAGTFDDARNSLKELEVYAVEKAVLMGWDPETCTLELEVDYTWNAGCESGHKFIVYLYRPENKEEKEIRERNRALDLEIRDKAAYQEWIRLNEKYGHTKENKQC